MENLVLTSKLLYNKDILDSRQEKYIYYKNFRELKILTHKFKQDLPNILHVNEVTDPIYKSECQLKPQYVRENFEDNMKLAINKLTKNSNDKFTNELVNSLLNVLIGHLISLPYNETNYMDEYVRICAYNNQIKPVVQNTINTLLFGHDGFHGGGSGSRYPFGLLYRKARFKCISCGLSYCICWDSDDDSLCGSGVGEQCGDCEDR